MIGGLPSLREDPPTPQIVMKFTLPIDREFFEATYHGVDWKAIVEEVDSRVRSWIKHGNNFGTVDEALEAVRSIIFEEMADRHIGID